MSRISTTIAAAAMFAVSDVDALRLTQVRPLDEVAKSKVDLARSQMHEVESVEASFMERQIKTDQTHKCGRRCGFKVNFTGHGNGTYTVTTNDGHGSSQWRADYQPCPELATLLDQNSTTDNTILWHATLFGRHGHFLVKRSEEHDVFAVFDCQPDGNSDTVIAYAYAGRLSKLPSEFQNSDMIAFATKFEAMIAGWEQNAADLSVKIENIFPIINCQPITLKKTTRTSSQPPLKGVQK